ncbi:hypothetical protein AAHI06_05060 [Pseudomonas salmasensis]|uniref:hypothetical protein n=1 Tax=Pseudomonas salmasensis TaxID=2745514 RepID=UPI00321938A9
MTFRLDLMNRAGLFCNYAAWHEKGDNWKDSAHFSFSYYLGACVYALEKMEKLQAESIEQFKEIEPGLRWKYDRVYFRSPGMFDIAASYSSFLLNLRLAQNTLLTVLGKHLKKTVPQSMTSFMSKLNSQPLDKVYRDMIESYWNSSGDELRHYRDLDQHRGLVLREFWIDRSGPDLKLLTYLPDNPRSHKSADFTYRQKKDALSYALAAFGEFHTLVNDVSVAVGFVQEKSFGDNHVTVSSMDQAVSLLFDPFQNKFCVHESLCCREKPEYRYRAQDADLDKYEFIKVNKLFPIKKSFTTHGTYFQ